ncbi:MAG: hypothetical protein LBE20_00385 [Deltaproteobacteria bacterium]|nr:hypothetical protein [Deltaproteobacteria bacterium]
MKAANLVNSILLTKMLNILQGAYYINRASDVKSQRKFIKGWLSRVVVK